jgi:beta-N-acetylglucosaminidase
MKKLILAIILLFNFQSGWVVRANIQCSVVEYTLSNIVGHNQFETLGCFSTFSDAQNAMNTAKAVTPNLIITHETSPSFLKIISASRAVVASYPARLRDGTRNAETVNILRSSTLSSSDSTYMPGYHDFRYIETTSYNPVQTLVNVDINGNIQGATGFDPNNIAYTRDTSYHQRGVVKVEVSGFVGFMNIAAVDIIPIIYVENNWTITLGGKTYLETQLNNLTQEKPYTIRPRVNEYRVTTNANGLREISHENFSFYSGNTRGTYTYGPAPQWLPDGKYFSYDGIRFYRDLDLLQPVMNGTAVGEYYQYFAYLPFRSTTNITAAQLDAFLENVAISASEPPSKSAMYRQGHLFINAQNNFGMNALLVYAMGLHESNRGLSTQATTKYNLFGWGAGDANPSDAYAYSSVEVAVNQHAAINLRGYMNPTDWRHFGQVVGNKNNGMNAKYASDPYWGQKIAGWAYRIDRYLNFIDYNYFPVIMVNDTSTTPLYKQASTTSVIQTVPARNQQRMFIASMIEGDWIMTPSLLPLDANRNTIYPNQSVGVQLPYHYSTHMAYIRPSNYRVINHSDAKVPHLYDSTKVSLPKQAMINTITVQNNVMTFNGVMTIPYLGADSKVVLTPRLILSKDGQQQIIPATSTVVANTNPSLNQSNFGFTSSFTIPDITLQDAVMNIELQYQSVFFNQAIMLPVVLNSNQNSVLMGNNHRVSFTQVSDQLNMNIAIVTIAQGDMNQDGRLSITDLVLMHRLILEIDPSNPTLISLGDMNQDGRLSVTDLVILHRTLLGLE